MNGAIRVLHVDDDTEFASMTATYLEEEESRLTVEHESDATRALTRLRAESFDCVVSDYEMPQMTGLDFLRAAREEQPDLPVLFLTGRGSETVAAEAISAGVTDYLQKGGREQYALLANRIVNYVGKRRAEKERRRGYEAIERAREGISILDADGEFVYTNEAFANLVGYGREELVGEHWELIFRESDVEAMYGEKLPSALNGGWSGQTVYERKDGELVLTNNSLSYTDEGELVSVAQDITDDERRRLELLEAKRFESLINAVTEYAVFMLDTDGRVVTWNDGAEAIKGYSESEVIGEHVSLFYPPESETSTDADALFAEALESGTATEEGWRVRSGGQRFWAHVVVTPVYDEDGSHQGFAKVTRDMTERRAREDELEAQRASLAAANRMNEILRDILREIVQDSSQEDIERGVCERLTDEEQYLFVASGDVTGSNGFSVRLTHDIDVDAAQYVFDHLPIESALERVVAEDAVVVQPIDRAAVDLDHELVDVIRSVVFIPLSYRETTYGVVALCAQSMSQLTDDERSALEDIGTAAGYGIHAVETERLLQADGVIELVFETSSADDPLVRLAADGTATLDRLVPVGSQQYLLYVTLDGVEPTAQVESVRGADAVDEVTVIHEDDDGNGGVVALTVSDTLVNYLASVGGKVHTTDVTEGTLRVVVDVSPVTDVSRVVDDVKGSFEGIRLASKRQVARPVKRTRAVAETVESQLTERQLAALQAAYHGGYFERPRQQTAEDVAATMGISASTFHQHLRIALDTVLTELFD